MKPGDEPMLISSISRQQVGESTMILLMMPWESPSMIMNLNAVEKANSIAREVVDPFLNNMETRGRWEVTMETMRLHTTTKKCYSEDTNSKDIYNEIAMTKNCPR